MRYRVDTGGSRLVARARSPMHEVQIIWNSMRGTVSVDPSNPTKGVEATVEVDMLQYDAGDWLRNRKIRKDLALPRYPLATMELRKLMNLEAGSTGELHGEMEALLHWRDRTVSLPVRGQGKVSDKSLFAVCTFQLEMGQLGISVPTFLMFRMDELVSLEATVVGTV